MSRIAVIASSFVISAAIFGVRKALPQVAEAQPRVVAARTLPVPDTVSSQMRQLIAGWHATAQAAPRTADEWKVLVQTAAAADLARIAILQDQFGVQVEARDIAKVECFLITPRLIAARNRHRLLVNLHGGGYVFGPGKSGTLEGVMMAALGEMQVLSIDYRMPPDFPYPAAMDDTMAVWKEVIKKHNPKNVGVFGTSTGGAMTLALVQRAKEEKVSLPGAIAPGTPWSDLSKTGDSYFTNEGVDNALVAYEPLLAAAAVLYAHGRDLKEPHLSPVYGDFHDFPPTILTAGTRDLFLSNTVRVHRKLRQAGVESHLEVYEGQSHAQYIPDPAAPETREAFSEIVQFFDAHLGR